jgi:hypothetical protein
MSQPHLEDFLSKSELTEWQKSELLEEKDKTTSYQKAIFWHRLRNVKIAFGAFHNYFITNGIFLQPELKEKLQLMSDILHEAMLEKEIEEEYPSTPHKDRFIKCTRVRKEGVELLKTIEGEVYARLWRESKLN